MEMNNYLNYYSNTLCGYDNIEIKIPPNEKLMLLHHVKLVSYKYKYYRIK